MRKLEQSGTSAYGQYKLGKYERNMSGLQFTIVGGRRVAFHPIKTMIAKPVKKPSKKVWRSKLDAVAGKICRFNGRCVKCRSSDVVQWAHIISRGYIRIRWDMDNCFCLCSRCHQFFTNHPAEWNLFIKEKLGEDKFWELHRRSTAYDQPRVDYNIVYEHLLAEWDRIQKIPNYNHAMEFHKLREDQI